VNIGGFIRRGESAALFVAAALAVLTCHAPARAQPPNEANRGGREESWSFFGGYTAYDLAAPGLHLGAEYPMGITPRFRSLASFAFQGHAADTQSGYALVARWGHRYTAGFGLTFESYLGVGLQLTRYDTTTFEFHDSVGVEKDGSKVRLGFMPQVVFGPGYDFAPLLKVPLHAYVRPGVQLIYPDLNLAFQVAVLAELGVRWTPGF
jgi:hypothetical protein